jgi:hypothetical protein
MFVRQLAWNGAYATHHGGFHCLETGYRSAQQFKPKEISCGDTVCEVALARTCPGAAENPGSVEVNFRTDSVRPSGSARE